MSFLILVTVIVAAGCGGGEPTATPAPATVVAEAKATVAEVQSQLALAGTSWTPEWFGGVGDGVPVLPDTYPSLHFMDERYNGFSGCDYFVGVYEVEGSTLGLQTPAITEGGCDETPLINQASSYMDLLWTVDSYEMRDGKLLLSAEGQLLLTMVPLEPIPFEDTVWELKFLSPDLGYWVAHLPDSLVTAKFDGETVSGTGGCNEYSAPYTRDGDSLTIGELTVTEKTCEEPDGVMSQESSYFTMLSSTGRIVESARSIQLLTDDGTPQLTYHGE